MKEPTGGHKQEDACLENLKQYTVDDKPAMTLIDTGFTLSLIQHGMKF